MRISNLIRTIVLVFVFVASAELRAQMTECDSVLAASLADQSLTVDSTSARSTATYAACSLSYQEFNNQMGASASGSYGLISGGGAYNKSNYEKWQQSNCSNRTASSSLDYYRYSAQTTFKPAAIQAWSDCMSKLDGLSCWASPSAGKTVNATIKWRSDEPDLPVVTSSGLSGGTASGAAPNELLKKNSQIKKGSFTVQITRKSPSAPIQGVVNAGRGQVAYTCTIAVPGFVGGNMPSPPPSLAQLINNGKLFTITYSKLLTNIGTIYPGRALVGTYTDGDKGWRVGGPNGADGHNLPSGDPNAIYGCGPVVPASRRDNHCYEPLAHELNVWGAIFTFDDNGVVSYLGKPVGVITVAQ